MVTCVREANAEIQPGGYFCRFDRPDDIDRMVVRSGVCFFKIASLTAKEENSPSGTAPVRKVIQISTMVYPEKDCAFIALCDDGHSGFIMARGCELRIYRRLRSIERFRRMERIELARCCSDQ